jgi:hypothetical protein
MTVHAVLVDSRDRDATKDPEENSYTVTLPRVYKEVIGARLVTAEIPCSYYVFTETNNFLHVDDQTLVVHPGNYSACDLLAALQEQADEAFGKGVVTLTLVKQTQKVCITKEGTFTVDGPLAPYLGFANAGSITATDEIVSPAMACTNPHTYLVLDIPELNGIDHVDRVNGSFAKVPCNADTGEYVYVDRSEMPSHSLQSPIASLKTLRIRWRHWDNSLVDFNGIDHAFTLELVTKDPSSMVLRNKSKPAPPTIIVNPPPSLVHNNTQPAPPPSPQPMHNIKYLCGGLVVLVVVVWWLSKTPASV